MRKEYDFSKAKRSKKANEVKVIKTFRLDPDILQWLEAEGEKQGMGYQTFLNWYLRMAMSSLSSVENRLDKLEEIVFKRKAS